MVYHDDDDDDDDHHHDDDVVVYYYEGGHRVAHPALPSGEGGDVYHDDDDEHGSCLGAIRSLLSGLGSLLSLVLSLRDG